MAASRTAHDSSEPHIDPQVKEIIDVIHLDHTYKVRLQGRVLQEWVALAKDIGVTPAQLIADLVKRELYRCGRLK